MQEKSGENIDFFSLRRAKGLTQTEAARLAGYSLQAVNALEKNGKGGKRLRARLLEVYTGQKVESPQNGEAATPPLLPAREPTPDEWKQRALLAEAKLRCLQDACNTMGQHVAALASTVQSFGRTIAE